MRCAEHRELLPQSANVFLWFRPSVFPNWCLWKLSFYPPAETGRYGDWDSIFLDDYRGLSQVLEKTFLGSKTNKRICKRFTYISKGQRKELKFQVF